MNEIVKMIVVLSLICGLSGFTLATVRDFTEAPIEEQVLTYVQKPAIVQVLPEHDNDPIKDRKRFEIAPGRSLTVFPAMRGGKLAAVAFESKGKGYGGDIGVMVGFSMETDALTGIGVTTMKETPGVGTRVAGHGFTTQFKGHSLEGIAPRSAGGDVETLAGATISSTGAATAVREAAETFSTLREKLAGSWS